MTSAARDELPGHCPALEVEDQPEQVGYVSGSMAAPARSGADERGRGTGAAWSGDSELSDASDGELLSIAAGIRARDAWPAEGWTVRCVDWVRRRPEELAVELRLPRRTALRLAAALELARRALDGRRGELATVRCARDAFELCAAAFVGLESEQFRVLTLDAKHRVKQNVVVSVGSLTSSIVHPREVFRLAVRTAAAAVICVHNHPSGDPEPSAEDQEVTRRLAAVGRTLGIPLLDHVVVGDRSFVSLRERISW